MSNKLIAVVISTTRRVYFGRIDPENIDPAARAIRDVRDQRQILGRWHTTQGVEELANDGPPADAQLSAVTPCNLWLMDVTNVRIASSEAEAAWCR